MTVLKRAVRTTAYASVLGCAAVVSSTAFAQDARPGPAGANNVEQMRAELAEARAKIAQQDRALEEQKRRLDLLEQRLSGLAQTTQQIRNEALAAAPPPTTGGPDSAVRVGEAPADVDRAPTVAVLDQQGSVVTRKGQLIGELGIDYARADRNRAIFRGVGFLENTILIGAFDINESRQDIFTTSGSLRFGLLDRLEIGARVPFLYRSDKQVRVPLADQGDLTRAIDTSVQGEGLGDVELTARYQINNGGGGMPFVIANLQATLPTGRDPFSVERDQIGIAQEPATGAGFLGIAPSVTAILPSEPAVLFGTLGYTFNFSENVDTRVGNLQIDEVDPGDQINATLGIGLALNERTSLNFGYNHAWTFGTTTLQQELNEAGERIKEQVSQTTRNLQIGRLLFGLSHRFSDTLQVNWALEVGATEDAPDVKTSLRVPIVIFN